MIDPKLLFKHLMIERAKDAALILASILILYGLTACGTAEEQNPGAGFDNGACAGETLVGSWQGVTVPSDVLEINTTCRGYDSYCEAHFNWSPINDDGTIDIDFLSTKGGSFCPASVGLYNCAINEQPSTLTIDCGDGPLVFSR